MELGLAEDFVEAAGVVGLEPPSVLSSRWSLRVVALECYISAEKTVPDTIDQAILEPDLQTIDDDNDKANEGSVALLRLSHRGG